MATIPPAADDPFYRIRPTHDRPLGHLDEAPDLPPLPPEPEWRPLPAPSRASVPTLEPTKIEKIREEVKARRRRVT